MFKKKQHSSDITHNPFSHLRCSPSQRAEMERKAGDEGFNFVPLAGYFVPVSFITAVKRNLRDTAMLDATIGVDSLLEAAFWESLDEGLRGLVGPTIAFLREHDEWFESYRSEIADCAARPGSQNV